MRAALDAGIRVVPVPGASALLAALVASGLSTERFTFYGFLARKGRERGDTLDAIASSPVTAVLYEGPGRVAAYRAAKQSRECLLVVDSTSARGRYRASRFRQLRYPVRGL